MNDKRKEAGEPLIEVWTPHQLRHTAATEFHRRFTIEAAQVMLGHSSLSMTELYAEKNEALAIQIAKEMG